MSITQSAELLIKFSNLQARISKQLEHQLSVHGISYTEFLVLYYLIKSPNENMRRIDLAQKISLTASGVTRLLLPMEKIGLVKKEENPRDARVSMVKITKAGKKIFSEAEATFNQSAASLTKTYSDWQTERFLELTEEML